MKHLAHLGFHLLFFRRDVTPLAKRLALRKQIERRNLGGLLRRREIQRFVAAQRLGLIGRLTREIEELGHAIAAKTRDRLVRGADD